MFYITHMPQIIDIGYIGEEKFRTIEIDMTEWIGLMPDGVPSIVAIRPGEDSSEAYLAATTFENNILRWTVRTADLGDTEGTGLAQVWLEEIENNTLNKQGMSTVFATLVHQSLDSGENVPAATTSVLQQMTTIKGQTIAAAEDSEAWAVGERGGIPVVEGDDTYHNNSEYYAEQSHKWVNNGAAGDPGDENNAMYYAEQSSGYADDAAGYANDASGSADDAAGSAGDAADSATDASGFADDAARSAEAAEAWATGGSSGTPGAENNAMYYAGQAAGSANDAAGYADDASGYADNASGSASDAAGSADDASGYADAASGSATEASGYADDAADSAAKAELWATGGSGGTPGAENNAEYWAGVAEDAAEALTEIIDDTAGDGDTDKVWSADKLVDEFGDLKSAINNVYSALNYNPLTLDNGLFEQGSVSNAGVYVSSTVAIRLKEKIPVKAGMVLSFKAGTNCKRLGLRFFNNDGTVTYYNGWIRNNNPMWVCSADTNLMIVAQNDGTTAFTPSDFDAHIEIQTKGYIESITIKDNSLINIDTYGYYDDYVINENGIREETGTPARPHSVTQYIPIKSGGKILFFFDLYSMAYGLEFKDSTLEKIEFDAMTNTLMSIDVPENAAYVRFTIFKDMPLRNKSLYYLSNDKKLDKFNVTISGAVGDSKTDNTAVLQRTIDVCSSLDIPIYFPTGKYLITDSLIVNRQNTTIFGDNWKMYSGSRIVMKTFEQTVDGSGNIVYPTTEGLQDMAESPVLNGLIIRNSGCSVYSMQFIPNFRSQNVNVYDSENLVATGIKINVSSGDIDCDIYGCQFRGCNNGISVTGRNAKLHDNTFVHCNTGVEILWSTRYSTDQREIMVQNNRFHSCGRNTYGKNVAYDTDHVCVKFPDYVLPNIQREIIVRDNFADYCGVFVSGQIYGAQIEQNTAYLCRNSFVESEAETYSPEGEGTTYSGTELYVGGEPSENKVIRERSDGTLYIANRSGTILTAPIPVSEGNLVKIDATLNSKTYYHGLTDSNGNIVDGIRATAKGNYYVIPEGVTGIMIAMRSADVSISSITIYTSKTTQDISTPYEIYPIKIQGNSIIGANKTDYTPGLNILEESIKLKLYKNIVIDGNEFTHGVGDVIVLDKCDKTVISSNKFINAPSYCEVYNSSDELVIPVPEGLNKNYIKMTNCENENMFIYGNIAMSGKRYDESDTPYVSVPVSADGQAYEYNSTNHFDHI